MSKSEKLLGAALVAALLVSVFAFRLASRQPAVITVPVPTEGSVAQGNDYHATTTTSASFVNYSVLQTGPGAFGSVVITTVGTSPFCLYDSTSTVTNSLWATTTLACFGASAPAGTYTFDVIFQKGLLLDYKAGTLASSTITSRAY